MRRGPCNMEKVNEEMGTSLIKIDRLTKMLEAQSEEIKPTAIVGMAGDGTDVIPGK